MLLSHLLHPLTFHRHTEKARSFRRCSITRDGVAPAQADNLHHAREDVYAQDGRIIPTI